MDTEKFITLEDYKKALQSQQEAFDAAVATHAKTLATMDAKIAALTEFKTRMESGIGNVVAAITDDKISPEDTVKRIADEIARGTAPEIERQNAEIDRQIAELNSKRR